MVKIITKELLGKQRPQATFKPGVDLSKEIKVREQGPLSVAEFVGAGDFAAAFYTRQQYEVDAGRDEEPILYGSIYNVVNDPNLPETLNINTLGPGGMVFEEVKEGGEVKFVTVGEGSKSVTIKQYGLGLEYTKKLFMFNQTWALAPIERWTGIAFNALMNYLHFYPILNYSYAAANQTGAYSLAGLTLEELYLRTLEDAITNSVADTTHPRRGPYALLIATGQMFMVERALQRRLQDGIDVRSSAVNRIQNVIVYDGWTATRGKKTTTYPGVTSGKAYLVSKQYASTDFQSYVKQALQSQRGDGDLSRFIVEQVVYDSWFGIYSDPAAAVEEITWPTTVS